MASRTCATWWRATCASRPPSGRRSDARPAVLDPRVRRPAGGRDRGRPRATTHRARPQARGPARPRRRHRGPIVVGRVLSKVPEPQKNGKTINWCLVDCGPEHNGEEGRRGIVCGADNFLEGDLVVVSLPGAVLPGGFAISARRTYGHVSDGMICSARELGIGEDHGGILVLDPALDGDVKPGDPVEDLLGLRDDVIEFEINPDRAYALSLRGISRDAAIGYGAEFRDPARRDVPVPNDQGYPVRVEAPDGCPVFATRTVVGFDPAAPTPRWIARRVQLAGMRPISLA